jgi:hypothetical protein
MQRPSRLIWPVGLLVGSGRFVANIPAGPPAVGLGQAERAVAVYQYSHVPERPYLELGSIETSCRLNGARPNGPDMTDETRTALQKKAAARRGTGVIVTAFSRVAGLEVASGIVIALRD